jgi:hypothetical protein
MVIVRALLVVVPVVVAMPISIIPMLIAVIGLMVVAFMVVVPVKPLGVVAVTPMALMVITDIRITVPIIGNKEDGTIAGVIFAAMSAPMPLVAGWHVHKEGRLRLSAPLNDNRFSIDEPRRRCVSEFNPPIKIRLPQVHRYPDLREGGRGNSERQGKGAKQSFHSRILFTKSEPCPSLSRAAVDADNLRERLLVFCALALLREPEVSLCRNHCV